MPSIVALKSTLRVWEWHLWFSVDGGWPQRSPHCSHQLRSLLPLPSLHLLALSISSCPLHSLTMERLSPLHRANYQVLQRLSISPEVMQSGSGRTRTGIVSRVDPRLCPHHPLLPGIVQALRHCPQEAHAENQGGRLLGRHGQACSLAGG